MMRRFAALLVVALLGAGCGPDGGENGGGDDDDGSGTATSVTVDDVVVTTEAVDVGCAIATVGTGGQGATRLISIDRCGEPIPEHVPVEANGRIAVDQSGEAWVTLAQDSSCGILYVFHTTELAVSATQPGSTAVGSVTSGSIGWSNECSGELTITTPSGTVTIVGTWVSVTYLPERDLSVFIAFEGVANVSPADDPDLVATLEAGSFAYTTSDQTVADDTGLPAGEALPVEVLLPFATELGLTSSLGSIVHRVDADGIPVGPLGQLVAVNVRAADGVLEDSLVQEALDFGLDWSAAAPLLVQAQFGAVTALFGPEPGRDLSTAQFSPERGQELLAQAGVEGVVVPLLFQERDAAAVDSLDPSALAPFLIVEPRPVADDIEARNIFAELTADGQPVIWIGRS